MTLIIVFQVYKKKTEAAKKDYLKALAAYRASLVSKVSKMIPQVFKLCEQKKKRGCVEKL